MKTTKSFGSSKNLLTKLSVYLLLAFVAYSIADLCILYYRDLMLPSEAPPKKVAQYRRPNIPDRSQFSDITGRNLFSSTGQMPEAIKAQKVKKEEGPVPSQLPIVILGTLVHSDPQKSLVALDLKTKNLSASFSTGADIEGMATIEKIQRNVIIIRNSSSGALEYIEMNKGANKVSFDPSKSQSSTPKAAGTNIKSTGNNTFALSRATLLKYTNDLSSVLMQARAVPNRDPVTGEINGFRLLDMQPGSIYEELGLQKMDVIKGVNGEAVDSVQKAMEMYNTLKNGTQVKMQIERGGKTDTFTYNIQ